MLPWFYSALGLLMLVLAGDLLVKGAVNLSLRLGVPALIVSLTVVAFGTSAPELLVAIKATLNDAPGIALGNVVGSNIANILLVLGIPALLATLHTSECDTRKSFLLMIGASVLFIGISAQGVIGFGSGLILLGALALILGENIWEARCHRRSGQPDEMDEIEEADPDMPFWRIGFYLVLGLVGLPMGASLLVDSASEIASAYGVSDTVIGLTLVAVGTSLPELATTVMAALRRQADVALGNVIGSNMFNLLAIIGVAAMFGPIRVDPEFLDFDLWVMLGSALLIVPFVFFRRDITWPWGLALTVLYLGYVATLLF
ncbi:calcium/sodium antiporter [Marinibacterium profundimaris]|uniref:Sodium:proton exchanger n=1 Tax=Marinibacterium profundimaris TaxID=1679460 RepID=A0A225NR63_9RHOB|nr:calcium/sodium antiporter [Marinibacterium profundimaris]OWU73697.1 sodium:proton exchanger [Marinibacterium profundimaris]